MRSTACERYPPARAPIGQVVWVLSMAFGGLLWLASAMSTSCAEGTMGSGRVAPQRVPPDVSKPVPLTAKQSEELLRRKQEREERQADEAQKKLKERKSVR